MNDDAIQTMTDLRKDSLCDSLCDISVVRFVPLRQNGELLKKVDGRDGERRFENTENCEMVRVWMGAKACLV